MHKKVQQLWWMFCDCVSSHRLLYSNDKCALNRFFFGMRSYLRLMLKIYSLYRLFASWHIGKVKAIESETCSTALFEICLDVLIISMPTVQTVDVSSFWPSWLVPHFKSPTLGFHCLPTVRGMWGFGPLSLQLTGIIIAHDEYRHTYTVCTQRGGHADRLELSCYTSLNWEMNPGWSPGSIPDKNHQAFGDSP